MLKFLWLHNHLTICNIDSTVGRFIASSYPIYREAMERPTILNILYTTVSAQQTNLSLKTLPNTIIFAQKSILPIYVGPPRNA